jgi:hypothetical protein
MLSKPSFISLAVWEHAYKQELASFDALLIRKARYLQSLKAQNLFDMPEPDALKMSKQIDFITDEITCMYGFKLYACKMRDEYMKSLESMYDFFKVESNSLTRDLKCLHREHEFIQNLYRQTIERLDFMTGMLLTQIQNPNK